MTKALIYSTIFIFVVVCGTLQAANIYIFAKNVKKKKKQRKRPSKSNTVHP